MMKDGYGYGFCEGYGLGNPLANAKEGWDGHTVNFNFLGKVVV